MTKEELINRKEELEQRLKQIMSKGMLNPEARKIIDEYIAISNKLENK